MVVFFIIIRAEKVNAYYLYIGQIKTSSSVDRSFVCCSESFDRHMESHNSRFAKIRGARFAPPMGAMPHPTLSLTLFSRCTLIVIIEKYYLVNNMHEECLFIQVRYNTAISPVHVIPTLQTCRIVYYILLYKAKSVALCFRLDQLIAYYCGRRNMAKFTSRFPRLRIPFNHTVG